MRVLVKRGHALLWLAAQDNQPEIVQLLIERNADVNSVRMEPLFFEVTHDHRSTLTA